MLVPTLYSSDTTDFFNFGIGPMNGITKCEVVEVLNGEFELDITYPVTGSRYSDIETNQLILAKPNPTDPPHAFRIYECNLDSKEENLAIKAHSNTFDLAGNAVIDLKIESKNPEQAMNMLKAEAIEPCDFTFVSDITTLSSTHWTQRSLLNCISGQEGSLIQIWGGEIKRSNKRIDLYKNRGDKNVTTIRHGKNLKGLTVDYSVKGLVTAIVPYYVLRNEDNTETSVFGDVVKSKYVDNYPVVQYQFELFTAEDHGTIVEDTDEYGNITTRPYIDIDILNDAASTWFDDYPEKDTPSVKIEAELEDLSQMEDYYKFKAFETLKLGDTVTVYSEKYDVNLTAKVIKVVYDCLSDKIKKVEIGQISSKAFDDYKEYVDRKVNPVINDVDHVINDVNFVSLAAGKKNRVFRGPDIPESGMGENDIWYKPVGDGEVEMYRFDGFVWRLEKVSAGLLSGTLDAASGDLSIINLNANHINTGILSGGLVDFNLDLGTFTIGPAARPIFDWNGTKLTIDLTGNQQIEELEDSVYDQIKNESEAITEQLEAAQDSIAETINDLNNDINEELGVIDTSLLEYQQRMEALDGEGGAIELTAQELENIKSTVVGLETILGEQSARWSFINNRIIEMANGNIWIGDGDATEDGYSTGILIGPNYDPVTGLTKNRIAFYNQGILTAYIQDGLMRIDHGIFIESATISNFKFEAISGTDVLSISFVG